MSNLNRENDNGKNDAEAEYDVRKKRRKVASMARICSACRGLNLKDGFSRVAEYYKQKLASKTQRAPGILQLDGETHYTYQDGFLIHRFGGRLSTTPDCRICNFFRQMRIQPSRNKMYKLMAFYTTDSAFCCLKYLEDSEICGKISGSSFLAVVPDCSPIPPNTHIHGWVYEDIPAVGAIFNWCVEDGASELVVRPQKVDSHARFDILRNWLTFCRENHSSDCSPAISPSLITKAFRLIDCFKGPEDPKSCAWGTPYVALSYVWGESAADGQKWPATILDAVSVTKRMGFRYLWVDRLCIDQGSDAEKEYLISKMAAIYEYAEFVIIAAAGSGASYGLCGVGDTPRRTQPSVQLEDGTTLLSTCPDPRAEILNSTYWTRGWTYQEAILARRRLVFTEHQAYWECRCMAVHESITIPLDLVHEEQGTRMARFMRSGIFRGPDYSGGAAADPGEGIICSDLDREVHFGFQVARDDPIRSRLRGLAEHVREFTARRLGRDKDSLKAFLGIAEWYRSTHQLHLILGIPAWIGAMPGNRPGAQITFAYSVSSWYHLRGNEPHVFVAEACGRRTDLPSWTWAGWKGRVTWRSPPANEHPAIMCEMIREPIDLIWGADISLHADSGSALTIHLRNVSSVSELEGHESVKLLTVNEPLILSSFAFHSVDEKKENFVYKSVVGRPGEKVDGDRPAHDFERLRLKHEPGKHLTGRLVVICLSVEMTKEEWIQKHSSGKLVSVLMWARRTPCTTGPEQLAEHGMARFLTLRQVASPTSAPRWERVGVFQFGLVGFKNCELGRYRTEEELLEWLPVKSGGRQMIIQ